MSKKVLILSSSPRKNGNSDYLCEQFLKGAVESGHEVEKIFVSDKDIKFCRACNVCQKTFAQGIFKQYYIAGSAK